MEKFGIQLTSDETRVIFQKYGCSIGGGNKIKFRHFIKLMDPTQINNTSNNTTTSSVNNELNSILKAITEMLRIKYGSINNGCDELVNECIYIDLHHTGYITSKEMFKMLQILNIDISSEKLMSFINYFHESTSTTATTTNSSNNDEIDYELLIHTLQSGYITINNNTNNKRLNQLTMTNNTSSTNKTAIRTLGYTSLNNDKNFNNNTNLYINTQTIDNNDDDTYNNNNSTNIATIKTVHGIYNPETVIEKIDRFTSPSTSQKRPFIQKTTHFSSQEITRIFQKLKKGCLDMYGTKINIEKKIKHIFYELINIPVNKINTNLLLNNSSLVTSTNYNTTNNNSNNTAMNKDQFLQLLALLGFNRNILNNYDISVITEWLEHHKDGNLSLNDILQVFGLV